MTAETLNIYANDIIQKYKSGFSCKQLAILYNCSTTPIYKILDWYNIKRRPFKSVKKKFDINSAISQYKKGASILSLSKIYGVDRNTIKSRFVEKNVPVRSSSDAADIRMKKLTELERKKLTSNANKRMKGYKMSLKSRIKNSETRQKNITHIGYGENEIFEWCQKKGLTLIPQYSIGCYNIDLAIKKFAVEIKINTCLPHHHRLDSKKIKYLLNLGWNVIYIFVSNKSFICESQADQICSFFNFIRSNPSKRCEYRVIGREGKIKSVFRFNRKNFTLVISS